MAVNEFYVEGAGAGSDVAAGSTTGAPLVTSTNGDWGSVTANRFTPAGGGTPFSAVTVGMWASIYLDGATLLVYLAQVTAVNGGGATLDFSTTAKYGTAPATGATGRSLKIGGSWLTPYAFVNTGTTAVYNATRINVKAGTFNHGTTTRTFNNAGSATAPLVWRGFMTTPGDLDVASGDPAVRTSWPIWQFATVGASVTFSGAKQWFTNFAFINARTNGTAFTVTEEVVFTRCRFETSNVSATSLAMTTSGGQAGAFNYCHFKAPSICSRVVTNGIPLGYAHCVFQGGLIGMESNSGPYYLDRCLFVGNGSHGLNMTAAARVTIVHCSFKGCGGDGIKLTSLGVNSSIRWNLFDSCVGSAVSCVTATQTAVLMDNDIYNCGASYTGWTDPPLFFPVTESSNPAVSSSDPTFSGVTFNGASLHREFENYPLVGDEWDVGAAQRQA